jgi:hypothetical protein
MAEKEAAPSAPVAELRPLVELMAEAGLEKWQRAALLARRDLLNHAGELSLVRPDVFREALKRALHGGA